MQAKINLFLITLFFAVVFVFYGSQKSYAQQDLQNLIDSAENLFLAGRDAESLTLFEKAINKSSKEKKAEILETYSEFLGSLCYRMKRWDKAEKYWRLNLSVKQKQGDEINTAMAMYLLGMALKASGRNYEALSYYVRAGDILKKADPKNVFTVRLQILTGAYYYDMSDYEKALDYLKAGTEKASGIKEFDRALEAWGLSYIGLAYHDTRNFEMAIQYFEKYLTYEQAPMEDRRVYMGYLAMCYNKVGKPEMAYHYFSKAITGASGGNALRIYMNYGRFLLQTGKFDEAGRYLKKAYSGFTQASAVVSSDKSRAAAWLGDYWQKTNNPDSALHYYQKALQHLCTGFADNDLMANPPPESALAKGQLRAIWGKKAGAFYAKSQQDKRNQKHWLHQSLKTYRLASDLIGSAYTEYQTDESRIFLAEDEASVFAEAVGVCHALYASSGNKYWLEAAFRFAERGRSGALMAASGRRAAMQAAGVPGYVQDYDQKLHAQIMELERDIAAGTDDPAGTLRDKRGELVRLQQQREDINAQIKQKYPAYHALQGHSYVPELKLISAYLKDSMALIEYVCQDTVLWIFAADNAGFDLIPVAVDSSFYADIEHYKKMLSTPAALFFTNEDFIDYCSTAYRLWGKLIKPCSPRLTGKSRILVSSDARMGAFSFDGLISRMPDTSMQKFVDFRTPQYLARQYAFTYYYSAVWLSSTLAENEQPRNGLLVFSPEYSQSGQQHGSGFNLPPLQGADREAENIALQWKGTLYKGQEANIHVFLQRAPEASILHLAMHSVVDEQNPLLSKLIFTCRGDDTCVLDAAGIYSMRLKAALVVLSSCSSGSGKAAKGEGVLSLARAFIYAGSKSVVMALWPVNDEAGSEIMQDFYHEMKHEVPADVALKTAKLKFLRQSGSVNSHPSYWAAYAITGNASVHDYHENEVLNNVVYGAVAFLLIAVALIIHVFARKKRHKPFRVIR